MCACGGENIEKDILGDWYNANDDTVVTFTFTEEKCELLISNETSGAGVFDMSYVIDEDAQTVTVSFIDYPDQPSTVFEYSYIDGELCLESGENKLEKIG